MRCHARTSEDGVSLLETLVAVSLIAIGLSALAQLLAVSIHANARARRSSIASVLAEEKLEQLRGLGSSLAPQPGISLDVNTPGLCDFLDEYGHSLGTGPVPPPGTAYIRRWSITPLPADPAGSFLLQVVVARSVAHGVPFPAGVDPRHFGGAQLAAVRARRIG